MLRLALLTLLVAACAARPPSVASPAPGPSPAAAPAAAVPPAAAAAPVPAAPAGPRVIAVTARKWSFSPSTITLTVGEPAVLEVTSLDRKHGLHIPALGLRADVKPGETARLALTPESAGRFPFVCDVFCGEGHEDMTGEIVVLPAAPPR